MPSPIFLPSPAVDTPYWESFFENDATFQIRARQMGITGKRLIRLLEDR
jgi:hypothetical protein